MTTKNTSRPYYSIQYLLRELAKGLGTKSKASKKIDDACKQLEINPFELDVLKQQLIHEPLTKLVNIYFADHVLNTFNDVVELYIDLMRKVPLDGVNADIAHQYIDRYFMTFFVAYMCRDMLDGMRLTPRDVAWSNKNMMLHVLENLDRSTEWQGFLANATDEQKERIRVWKTGKELPKFSSLSMGECWERGNGWGTFKARLVIGRLWDHFFSNSHYVDLELLKHHSLESCLNILIEKLNGQRKKVTEQYKALGETTEELFQHLLLRHEKGESSRHVCQQLLNQLDEQTAHYDKNEDTKYFLHWMRARFLLHSGQLEEAIPEYQQAFEKVLYRQVINLEKIVTEAIVVACRCSKPKKRFINRLRRIAVIMNFDFKAPQHGIDEYKSKPEDIELWEMMAFSHAFSSHFPKDSFFPGATYPTNPHNSYGPWIVDESKYSLDIDNPNAVWNVGEAGGMIKSMPQLVYYAMNEGVEEVEQLLNAGADVNEFSATHDSAILLAVQSMQVNLCPLNSMDDSLFQLLSQKPHRKSVLDTLTDKRKLSPLGCAVQTGRIDIVEKLLDMGASVDRRHDTLGETPLFTAIGLIAHHTRPKQNALHWEMMKYSEMNLQSMRANANGLMPYSLRELKLAAQQQESDECYQRLHKAMALYQMENILRYTTADDFRNIAKLLIQRGANPNAKHNTGMLGYTPLMLAIELDEPELVKAIVQSQYSITGHETCVNSMNRQRLSLFQLIEQFKSKKVAELIGYPLSSV